MTAPLRVVIADDQALVRAGFRMILTADGIDVVAEAEGGAEEERPARPAHRNHLRSSGSRPAASIRR